MKKAKKKILKTSTLDAIKAMRRGGREAEMELQKIMRVLNAFYQYMTERDGKEPMPIVVFKERKKVINELSKG